MHKDENQKNLLLAIVLSMAVVFGWQYFYAFPQAERQRAEQQAKQQATALPPSGVTASPAQPSGAAPPLPGAPAPALVKTRAEAIAGSPRVAINTPRVTGSIALRGGRIDDLVLKDYRENVDAGSPNIVLLSPEDAADGYFASFGWLAPAGAAAVMPGRDTLWSVDQPALSPGKPVTLTYENGQGLAFSRKIEIDENYLFTVTESVENKSAAAASLSAYGLVTRHGTPKTEGIYVLHEGLIAVVNDQKLQEITYADLVKAKTKSFKSSNGWLGITDKYWATAIIPEQGKAFDGAFAVTGTQPVYSAYVPMEQVQVAPGQAATSSFRFFAGAKESKIIDAYESKLGVKGFDLLIDWGWFYFITKPLFQLIDWIFRMTGNFGVAILLVTVLVKMAFFWLANKSYESMARMKAVQPEMMAIKERFPDDRAKQQQAMMELYKKEKINPVAGCLPIIVQIPVFFALYKVIYVTIEMRHAKFFGWIKDLSAADPTSVFNLFGLIPVTLPDWPFLQLGVWPLVMGMTMWLQMKMNPEPTDPIQKQIFSWMPFIFTFMLGTFPAGLVIYWAWNNLLSIIQQYVIMRKNNVKVELWDNLRGVISKLKKPAA